jgi:hypothetical protein
MSRLFAFGTYLLFFLFSARVVSGARNLRGVMLPLTENDAMNYNDDDGIDLNGPLTDALLDELDMTYYDDVPQNYYYHDNLDGDDTDLVTYFYHETDTNSESEGEGDMIEFDENDDIQSPGFAYILPLYLRLLDLFLEISNQNEGRVLREVQIDSILQNDLSEHPMSWLLLGFSMGAFALLVVVTTLRSKLGHPLMDQQIK